MRSVAIALPNDPSNRATSTNTVSGDYRLRVTDHNDLADQRAQKHSGSAGREIDDAGDLFATGLDSRNRYGAGEASAECTTSKL
jgi:hypothetical protein